MATTGPTTETWKVSLGNETHMTPVLQNANHGFTGWQKQTLSFVVTSATEVLSFLAIGTPAGVPPFTLLDGVTISEVSEAAKLGAAGRRRRPDRRVASLVRRRRVPA